MSRDADKGANCTGRSALFILCVCSLVWRETFSEAYPLPSKNKYGFTSGETGLSLLEIAVEVVLGCGINLLQDRLYYVLAVTKHHESPPSEIWLVPAVMGHSLTPIGLFWFA